MHCTHSILARRMDTNEAKAGKTSLVYIVSQELALRLAIAAIQFTDTSKNSVREYSRPSETLAHGQHFLVHD